MTDLFGRKRRKQEAELRERELALAEKQADIEDRKLKQQRTMIRMMQDDQAKKDLGVAPMKIEAPSIMKGVVPVGEKPAVAMDSCQAIYDYASVGTPSFFGTFIGYPALAAMSQSSDYRCVAETTATEMTREWGRFKVDDPSTDESSDMTDAQREAYKLKKEKKTTDRQNKINAINAAFETYGIRDMVRQAIEVEMGMGRAQIYIRLDDGSKDEFPFVLESRSIKKGSLKGFRLIEPMWSTPSVYNANDPTAPDFYVPTQWYVLGRPVASERLMTLIMRPVSDILKPAYNFGGISMFQLMKPYVERYQRTADSVSWMIQAFSLTVLSTDMSGILSDGESDANLWVRTGLLSKYRDNTGTLMLDKESEEINQINTPLTGLNDLLTSSQEQMAGPSHTPLVKLVGTTPGGLGGNSDGEITVYRDYIMAQNEAHIRPLIMKISALIQLDLFGEIDPAIVWVFNPLEQMNTKELAETQELNGRNAAQLVDKGIISQQEARKALSADEESPFSGIDVDDVPEMPDMDDAFTDEGESDAGATTA